MKDRKIFRNLTKAVVFLLLFVFMFRKVNLTLMENASITKLTPFFEDAEDYDVLFTGISLMQFGLSPMQMWDEQGIASFDLAQAGNRLPSDYWVLKNALEYTDPKLVVIDVRRLEVNDRVLRPYVQTDHDYFPLTPTKIRAGIDIYDDPELSLIYIFPILRYHTRWTELTKSDFIPPANIDKGASFYAVDGLKAKKPAEHEQVNIDDTIEPGELSLYYLEKMVSMCKEKGIEVLLLHMPFPADEDSQRIANKVYELADEWNVNYVNLLREDGIVDYETDLCNRAHLNDSGKKKVSSFIASYIMEHYDIPDRRTDESYASWNEDYDTFRQFKRNRIISSHTLTQHLILLADKETDVYIRIPEGSKLYEHEKWMKLVKNLSLGEGLPVLEEAEKTGSAYQALIECGSSRITESQNTVSAMNLVTGPETEILCSEEEASLTVNGEACYLSDTGGEKPAAADIQILVIDPESGEMIDSRAYSAE